MTKHSSHASALPASGWRKASRCGPNGGNCVEVNRGLPGTVGVRDSKSQSGATLIFTAADWTAFLRGGDSR